MRRLELDPETVCILGKIEQQDRTTAVYGMKQTQAWALVAPLVRSTIDKHGVTLGWRGQYFSCGRELTRLFRTLAGARLVAETKLVLRKWVALGLDSALVQAVIRACCKELLGPVVQVLPAKPKPARARRKKRSYQEALEQGEASLGRSRTIEQQAVRHRRAAMYSREVSRIVRKVLLEHDVPLKQFIRYNAFAFRLDKLKRNYGEKTLERAAFDLVDLYEAKSLNREVLLHLCHEVADIEIG